MRFGNQTGGIRVAFGGASKKDIDEIPALQMDNIRKNVDKNMEN